VDPRADAPPLSYRRDAMGDHLALRRATRADTPALAAVLARAFDDDPWVTWLVRGDRRRPWGVRRLFEVCLDELALRHDETWTDEARRAAALWIPPGRWKLGAWEQLRLLPDAGRISGWGRLAEVARASAPIARAHPRAPHWYLLQLGVDPPAQGQGLGRALLAPALARCDRDGVGAYLETARESNVAFYRRDGFELRGEHALPGGPTVWTMWRGPRR
jgi:ribosomal protein S18 acetylase RimI-like enzyme